MKITHCYRTYLPDPPGGVQEAIHQICLATSKLGVKNNVYCLSPDPVPKLIDRPECQVVRSRSWAAPASCDLGGPDSLVQFSRLMKNSDILHYHFPWPFADLLHLFSRPKVPYVMTYHSDIVRQKTLNYLYSPLMWKVFSKIRFVVATSQAYLNTSPVLSHPSIRDRVRVIPLGIDENSYPSEGDNGVFERLDLLNDEPYFLFLGVLRYYKGLHTLIMAAVKVDAKVVIAGSGPEIDRLKKLVMQSGAKNLIFAGQVSNSEKVSLIKGCCSFVLPSHLRSEAFGMVLVEAAMFGRPLISCDIGSGTSYVNAHEETGLVVPPEDPDSLARAMNTVLVDVALANSFGRGARKRYEELFSGPVLGRAYMELYREALM